VERVEFVEDQITIKPVIPISDVGLPRDQLAYVTIKYDSGIRLRSFMNSENITAPLQPSTLARPIASATVI
jgi:hypothetical protein